MQSSIVQNCLASTDNKESWAFIKDLKKPIIFHAIYATVSPNF